jgi:uncharacterized protein (TIGR03435 family)
LPAAGAPRCIAQTPAATDGHAKGDISVDWQGTLTLPNGKALRTIVKVDKTDKGFAGKMYSIDQTPQPISLSSITVDGSAVKYAVEMAGISYTGTLSPDGNSVTGTFSQGPNEIPFTLVRASKETAWEIPAPPPPVKRMAADADPSFDVATIKPADPAATSMKGLTINGRNFATTASSLGDLISFAYQVQLKQIVGAPDWMTKDRYDIAAVPVEDGAPSPAQVRTMIRKLLADRFKLTFHNDKRELPAFVLTVAKTGSKLKETEMKGPLPGLGFRPAPDGVSLAALNAAMDDFTQFLQSVLLDRPVVDQTGLKGKYDISMTFTPDDSQFNGHPPQFPRKEGVEPAPSLFDAMQQTLGLKLEAQKTMVPVLAIDHVEKPSGN